MITIRLRKNGPYVIESDDVRIVDADGKECQVERRPIALCRCGASTTKPFCDGTHRSLVADADCERLRERR
jgi:CDGSH-type Zn-finger protein